MENGIDNHSEKIGIPDSDAHEWIKILREMNLSQEEIDEFMSRLNRTYREQAGGAYVEKELSKIEDTLNKQGKKLTEEQKKYLRESILKRD